jgi:heme/copper-type cytochrome/quinol oxidase subunit 1
MRFRLPASFRTSKTVRLHTFAFAILAIVGMVITAFFRVYSVDIFYFDKYFPIAIGHLILAAASLFGVFAVSWTIFQALARRGLHEPLGQTHFWLTFAGILLSVGCLSAFTMGLARTAVSATDAATLTMYALFLTLGVQLVLPAAVLMSFFRPKTNGSANPALPT